MKEQLEIQHIVPYLPFGLKAHDEEYGETFFVCSYRQDSDEWLIHDNIDGSVIEYSRDVLKPILRPLSDLTKEIEHNGEKFTPCLILFPFEEFDDLIGQDSKTYAEGFIRSNNRLELSYPLFFWTKLYEWHFDVFGLIEKGLAISYNNL